MSYIIVQGLHPKIFNNRLNSNGNLVSEIDLLLCVGVSPPEQLRQRAATCDLEWSQVSPLLQNIVIGTKLVTNGWQNTANRSLLAIMNRSVIRSIAKLLAPV